jgi:hypothetical protein
MRDIIRESAELKYNYCEKEIELLKKEVEISNINIQLLEKEIEILYINNTPKDNSETLYLILFFIGGFLTASFLI